MATLKVCRRMRVKPSTWRNRLIRLREKKNGGRLEKTLLAMLHVGSVSDIIEVAFLLGRHETHPDLQLSCQKCSAIICTLRFSSVSQATEEAGRLRAVVT